MNTTTLYVIQFNNGTDDVAHWVDLSAPYRDAEAATRRINALANRNTFMHYRLVERIVTENVIRVYVPQQKGYDAEDWVISIAAKSDNS